MYSGSESLESYVLRCCCRCCCGCGCTCCSGCRVSVARGSGRQRAVCCFPFLPVLSVVSCSHFSLSTPATCRSRALLALPSWLLATLFDGLAPSAGVGRCPYGPTMRFATRSCVCSTRGSPHALNSHLLLAHLGPSPRPCAPPGLSLRSRAPPLGLNFSLLLSLCFLSTHFSLFLPVSLALLVWWSVVGCCCAGCCAAAEAKHPAQTSRRVQRQLAVQTLRGLRALDRLDSRVHDDFPLNGKFGISTVFAMTCTSGACTTNTTGTSTTYRQSETTGSRLSSPRLASVGLSLGSQQFSQRAQTVGPQPSSS